MCPLHKCGQEQELRQHNGNGYRPATNRTHGGHRCIRLGRLDSVRPSHPDLPDVALKPGYSGGRPGCAALRRRRSIVDGRRPRMAFC